MIFAGPFRAATTTQESSDAEESRLRNIAKMARIRRFSGTERAQGSVVGVDLPATRKAISCPKNPTIGKQVAG